jgi:hypothetical protein
MRAARRHRQSPSKAGEFFGVGAAIVAGVLLGAVLFGAAACNRGSGDTETSVYLEIYDESVVATATEVTLSILDPTGAQTIGTLHRTLAAQTSATAPLGSVVILPGVHATLGALRIKGQRTNNGASLSEGVVDVALEVNRQVSARLMLSAPGRSIDGGTADAGGGLDLGAGGDAAAPVDTGMPVADAGPETGTGADAGGSLLLNGDSCRSGGACNSGFCADGVCCDSACTDLCHGCNLSGSRGSCRTFAPGSQCQPATCTASDSLIPARTCDGNGNCAAAGATESCGNYRCQNDACLRLCANSNACISSSRCNNNRCQ